MPVSPKTCKTKRTECYNVGLLSSTFHNVVNLQTHCTNKLYKRLITCVCFSPQNSRFVVLLKKNVFLITRFLWLSMLKHCNVITHKKWAFCSFFCSCFAFFPLSTFALLHLLFPLRFCTCISSTALHLHNINIVFLAFLIPFV